MKISKGGRLFIAKTDGRIQVAETVSQQIKDCKEKKETGEAKELIKQCMKSKICQRKAAIAFNSRSYTLLIVANL